jgi:2-dehydro-3-deoxygluconokinase
MSPVAEIILNHARAAGVDISHVQRVAYDGVGRENRVGLYFAEIGTGVRGGMALYDRGHSSASAMEPSDVDWERLFQATGVKWLHSGGIYAVLSENSRRTLQFAISKAREAGTRISYDLNFRAALAAPAIAAGINREFVAQSDLLIGSEAGFQALLDHSYPALTGRQLLDAVFDQFPNLQWIAGTERLIHQANRQDFHGFASDRVTHVQSRTYSGLEVVDRVGTGDAFGAGLLWGLIHGRSLQESVDLGAAHGALVHTTRGDVSQFSLSEIEDLASNRKTPAMAR